MGPTAHGNFTGSMARWFVVQRLKSLSREFYDDFVHFLAKSASNLPLANRLHFLVSTSNFWNGQFLSLSLMPALTLWHSCNDSHIVTQLQWLPHCDTVAMTPTLWHSCNDSLGWTWSISMILWHDCNFSKKKANFAEIFLLRQSKPANLVEIICIGIFFLFLPVSFFGLHGENTTGQIFT